MTKTREPNAFEVELRKQIKERITAIEQTGYDFGKSFNKTDWLLIGLIIMAGLVLTIIGLF
ncbi:hypothetical protein FACS189450_09460 [Spirochaetia bacterium]|nr:hypothetical protein FACS189450_09460 [Spirochaetia bacterium]